MRTAVRTSISLLCGLICLAPHLGSEQRADTETRFTATVQTIVPLADFASGEVTPAAADPRFALTVRLQTTVPEVPEWIVGKVVTFAIHSPSELFEPREGETYEFILYGKSQDGNTRYFGLGRAYPAMMDSSYPRYAKAQKYLALGFYPVDCFAGRVRIKGKRLTRQSFSIYAPNSDMKCCGALVKSARTDQHGHFFAEPLKAGEYFAKFEVGGLEYVSSFAVISDYNECSAGYFVELDFSDVNSFKFQEYMILDDDGELCSRVEGDPSCFRK